ncbi:translation initiation factor eIF4e [Karstenula rhodostoma CBS 690.94]|uniref:Translation initiation factor eIF4e n=1 Tax=Karstenula rhodostoma CBS 690.94 TaxID=1392251 RepID=A0A9P4P8T1_9PLEO|nr:translation initiation factor eIF4e [Karstenula rhodostoma CBS 690.94]
MAETARLIGMLRASKAQRIPYAQPLDLHLLEDPAVVSIKTGQNYYQGVYQVPGTFSEALQFIADSKPLPPPPNAPLGQKFQPRLDFVIATLNEITVNTISKAKMAGRLPALSTSDLPAASPSETSATASPARGSAMLNSIFKSVRVPEFKYRWQFWAEKGQQQPPPKTGSTTAGAEEYANRPKPLGEQIVSVKDFYQHFNNIPVENLKLRDSIHLFHLGVKPLWEDPRNTRGGAWYFRISKEQAAQFWHEICLLAVGDVLQGAVETKRASFNDDICGVTYSVRWNAVQVAIWTRDADNEAGKEKLLQTILDKLSAELQPKKDSYWYKAHKEHKGFAAPE